MQGDKGAKEELLSRTNTCPISRLYDVDGDGVASKAEVEHITKVMRGFIISLTISTS